MKIVLVQIYRFAPEAWLLRKMAEVFLRSGYRMVLWTNREFGTAGLPAVPLSRGPDDDAVFNLKPAQAGDWPGHVAWEAFEKQFQDRYGRTEPAYESVRCHRISSALFDHLRPSLFLCWSGMDPWFAIPKQIARERGIPVLTWEAGMLPQTLLLDIDGICAESQWVAAPIPPASGQAVIRAEAYIREWKESLRGGREPECKGPAVTKYSRILILGGMDVANGVVRAQGTGKETLPGFTDGIDLAIQTAEHHPGETIYRPHPNEPPLPLKRLDGTKVALDRSMSLVDAILDADIVIGYGSKTDFLTMALGKPFIMAGIGLVTGKNCAYEATAPEQLAQAIAEASKRGRTEQQDNEFLSLVAWMLEESHYNRLQAGPCDKGIVGFVQDALDHCDSSHQGGDFMNLLSPMGAEWWNEECRMFRLMLRSAPPDELAAIFKRHLENIPDSLPVIDFDHTLWLANSTEQFIAQAAPFNLRDLADWSAVKIHAKTQTFLPFERDQLRVIAISLVMPWSWITWRNHIRRHFDTHWNHELMESCNIPTARIPVVISLGFDAVIRPILDEWNRRGGAQLPLIASKLSGKSTALRSIGKVAAMEKHHPDFDWNQTVSISDSEEDLDLLLRSRKSLIGRWREPAFQRIPGYCPFRYVAAGKYPGIGYVKNLIFGRDFVVWMLAYASAPRYIAPAILLFLSFHTIYEIGYYENDFTAARQEKKPTLSSQHAAFEKYRIEPWAWAAALPMGALGCFLATGHLLPAMTVWFIVLLSLRFLFAFYNRTSPEKRIPLYITLQFLKNFSGAFLMIPVGVGAALSLAHSYQHSTVYIIYRCKGNKGLFKRHHALITVFLIGLLCLLIANREISWLHLLVASVWIVHFSLTEINESYFNLRHYVRVMKKFIKKALME